MNPGNADRIGRQIIKFLPQVAPKGTDLADVLGGLEIAKVDLTRQLLERLGFVRLQDPETPPRGDR